MAKKTVHFSRNQLVNPFPIFGRASTKGTETKKFLQTPVGEQVAREKLQREIEETKAVAEREWLLGKV